MYKFVLGVCGICRVCTFTFLGRVRMNYYTQRHIDMYKFVLGVCGVCGVCTFPGWVTINYSYPIQIMIRGRGMQGMRLPARVAGVCELFIPKALRYVQNDCPHGLPGFASYLYPKAFRYVQNCIGGMRGMRLPTRVAGVRELFIPQGT